MVNSTVSEKGSCWNRGLRRLCTLCTVLYYFFKKILCQTCLLFYCFFVIKRILKALFYSILWLLNSSDLPSYDSNLKKRYTLRLLPMCLGRSTLCIGGKAPPPSIPSSIPLDGKNLTPEKNKNWLLVSKITWGIRITSDKQWKVPIAEIRWSTFVQKNTFFQLKHYRGFV